MQYDKNLQFLKIRQERCYIGHYWEHHIQWHFWPFDWIHWKQKEIHNKKWNSWNATTHKVFFVLIFFFFFFPYELFDFVLILQCLKFEKKKRNYKKKKKRYVSLFLFSTFVYIVPDKCFPLDSIQSILSTS